MMEENNKPPIWQKGLPLLGLIIAISITLVNFYIRNSSSVGWIERIILFTLSLYIFYQIGTISAHSERYNSIQKSIDKLSARMLSERIEGATCSFNDLYKIMGENLRYAEREIKVSSYIDKDPEILSDSQQAYHKLFKRKIKGNNNLEEICRIISVPSEEKMKWMLKIIDDFGNDPLYKNFTVYYDRDSSLAEDGEIIPLNVQIYDECVCIINPSCIKGNSIENRQCIYLKSREISESFSRYYDTLKSKFKDDWLLKNGKVNDSLVLEIKERFD